VPGLVEIGDAELELHPAEGHTRDGTAFLAPFAGVLVCGDYLSDVEIPLVSSVPDYRDTLARLASLVGRAETVIPGHGSPHDRDGALRLADEDATYLDALERGDERPRLPAGRDTARQHAIHSENVAKLG
jgi:glyoxylase-like metal-dependent hydrolase (beta-lactamase superfamily II)